MDYVVYLYISLFVDYFSGYYLYIDLYLDFKFSVDWRWLGYIEDIDGVCRYEIDIKGFRFVIFM